MFGNDHGCQWQHLPPGRFLHTKYEPFQQLELFFSSYFKKASGLLLFIHFEDTSPLLQEASLVLNRLKDTLKGCILSDVPGFTEGFGSFNVRPPSSTWPIWDWSSPRSHSSSNNPLARPLHPSQPLSSSAASVMVQWPPLCAELVSPIPAKEAHCHWLAQTPPVPKMRSYSACCWRCCGGTETHKCSSLLPH